jgi:hypothetical protein
VHDRVEEEGIAADGGANAAAQVVRFAEAERWIGLHVNRDQIV